MTFEEYIASAIVDMSLPMYAAALSTWNKAYVEGFAEARRRAAKIARDEWGCDYAANEIEAMEVE